MCSGKQMYLSPQTILALCAEVERMRAVVEAARRSYDYGESEHGHGGDGESCAFCGLGDVLAALDSAKEEKP